MVMLVLNVMNISKTEFIILHSDSTRLHLSAYNCQHTRPVPLANYCHTTGRQETLGKMGWPDAYDEGPADHQFLTCAPTRYATIACGLSVTKSLNFMMRVVGFLSMI